MELIPILVGFGLSAGTIGKIKGSSFWIWFAIGFCLPFIGTFVALVYRREEGLGKRACEECGAVVPMHDQVCRRCGADLWFPEEAVPARQQQLFQ